MYYRNATIDDIWPEIKSSGAPKTFTWNVAVGMLENSDITFHVRYIKSNMQEDTADIVLHNGPGGTNVIAFKDGSRTLFSYQKMVDGTDTMSIKFTRGPYYDAVLSITGEYKEPIEQKGWYNDKAQEAIMTKQEADNWFRTKDNVFVYEHELEQYLASGSDLQIVTIQPTIGTLSMHAREYIPVCVLLSKSWEGDDASQSGGQYQQMLMKSTFNNYIQRFEYEDYVHAGITRTRLKIKVVIDPNAIHPENTIKIFFLKVDQFVQISAYESHVIE